MAANQWRAGARQSLSVCCLDATAAAAAGGEGPIACNVNQFSLSPQRKYKALFMTHAVGIQRIPISIRWSNTLGPGQSDT